jgi:outer membrane receptor protein involved in Fe transport
MSFLKKSSLGLLSNLGVAAGWAQAPALSVPASLAGQVQEATTRQPLPGATVRLVRLPDTATVAGTQTDARGRYTFRAVPGGHYEVRARAIGFAPGTAAFTVPAGTAAPLELPLLALREAPQQLREVTVTAQQKAVEVSAGKVVYNIDQKVSAGGSSAFELLQRTPGVRVTQDDNLQLKGSPNVTVMVDGKLTYLSAQQLGTYLRGLPAEALARIEVLTTPGAQFDAAGNAGIINIVTKKSTRPGYALNLSTGAGTGRYPQTTQTAVGNYKTQHFNLFGNYSYHYKQTYLNRTSYRVLGTGADLTSYDRASFDPTTEYGHTYRVGLDLVLPARQTLGAVYSGYRTQWNRSGVGPTTVRNEASGSTYQVQNQNETREPGLNHSFNLNYKIELDTAGRQLTADADYARYRSDSRGSLGNQVYAPDGTPAQPYQELAFGQPSVVTIRAFKADVVWPLGKTKLTAGGKYSFVTSDNDFRYDSLRGGRYEFAPALSSHFIYDEHILAAYATASRLVGKTTFDAGLRLESTRSLGTLLGQGIANRRAYTYLFPTLTLSRPLTAQQTLSLSLSRRLNRPQYSDLNPARFFFDKYSYYTGNPFLQPETAWQLAATYTYKQDYVLTLSAGRTSRPLSSFGSQDPQTGVLALTIANFNYRDDLEAQLIAPLKISDFWSAQNALALRYVRADLSQDALSFRPRQANVDISTTHTLTLPAALRLEVAALYTSPSLGGITLFRTYFTVDAGLKRTFLNKKLDVRLAGTDLFNTIRYRGYSLYEGANTSYNHRGDNRRVNLSLTYHLGGELSSGRERRVEEADRVR